ncbi:MAG: hypothetical protein IJB91_05150 [Oscillospiraceae bacterium]|nr:hypothetical protein [Oscillospiraceae bacterium]
MLKRTICVLLSACLLISAAPLAARAEGEAEATTQATETTAPPTETTAPETTAPETTPPETTPPPVDDYTENLTRMSDNAIALLKQYEGFSKYPHWDVSQWSVGYGTRCPGDKLEQWKVTGITEREAESLLNGFVNNFGAKLDAFIAKYNLNLNQYQYDALMLFTYNCGAGWMNQTGLLQTAVITGAKGNDFIYPFVLWCKADRVFSNGLIERRLAEANLYLNGVYGRKPPKDYSFVRFDVNGGKSDYAVQGFDVDEPVPIKVIAAKTYTASNGAVYEFEGWYDKRVGGNKIEVLDASRGYATYLYAHWKLIKEGTGPSGGNDPGSSTLVDVVVTATSLNVRLGPGTQYDYAPPKGYPKGTQLTIVETKSDGSLLWGRVANTGTPGYWVALEYTDYYQVIQNQQQPTTPPTTQPPTTQPTQPPTTKPTEPPSTFGTWVGVVKLSDPGSKLYIRSEPSTTSTQRGHLLHGNKVTIVERKTVNNAEWGRMEAGWICLNYVSFDPADVNPPTQPTPTQPKPTEPAPTQPTPTQPKPTEPKPTEPKPTEPKPTEPKPTEPKPTEPAPTDPTESAPTEPSHTDTPETVFPDGDGYWIGVVNTAFLPIRSAAGTIYPIVGYCMRSDSLEVTRCITVDGQLWGRVNGGWICLSFVTLDGEDVLSGHGFMTVNTCSLRVRSGAGVENTIVAFLSYGEVIAIYDRQQVGSITWGLTDLGWVDLKYLQ